MDPLLLVILGLLVLLVLLWPNKPAQPLRLQQLTHLLHQHAPQLQLIERSSNVPEAVAEYTLEGDALHIVYREEPDTEHFLVRPVGREPVRFTLRGETVLDLYRDQRPAEDPAELGAHDREALLVFAEEVRRLIDKKRSQGDE